MDVKLGLLLALSACAVLAVSPAHAEVPSAADLAACTAKAAEDVKADAASASPRAELPKDATQLPSDAR